MSDWDVKPTSGLWGKFIQHLSHTSVAKQTVTKFIIANEIIGHTLLSCGLYYKSFTIVIYSRNDSTIIEPVL